MSLYLHTLLAGCHGVLVDWDKRVGHILLETRELEICPVCGEDFFPWPSTRIYCSKRCAATAARRRYRAAHKE